jgi:hypothetical protein
VHHNQQIENKQNVVLEAGRGHVVAAGLEELDL